MQRFTQMKYGIKQKHKCGFLPNDRTTRFAEDEKKNPSAFGIVIFAPNFAPRVAFIGQNATSMYVFCL